MTAPMFSDQEKEDLIQVMDEWLEENYKDFTSSWLHPTFAAYASFGNLFRRVALLFYVFTGADWEHESGNKITKEGKAVDLD